MSDLKFHPEYQRAARDLHRAGNGAVVLAAFCVALSWYLYALDLLLFMPVVLGISAGLCRCFVRLRSGRSGSSFIAFASYGLLITLFYLSLPQVMLAAIAGIDLLTDAPHWSGWLLLPVLTCLHAFLQRRNNQQLNMQREISSFDRFASAVAAPFEVLFSGLFTAVLLFLLMAAVRACLTLEDTAAQLQYALQIALFFPPLIAHYLGSKGVNAEYWLEKQGKATA